MIVQRGSAMGRRSNLVTMPRRRAGVGMYPDQTCFDAARASWLPNWLDNWNESKCKVNELLYGNQTGNTAQPGDPGVASETVANAMAACAAGGNRWDDALGVCVPTPLGTFGQYIPWIAAGLVAIIVLPSVLGGRR